MTIEFIKAWNSYTPGSSATLPADVEANLVSLGIAFAEPVSGKKFIMSESGGAVASVAAANGTAAAAATATSIAAAIPAAAPAGGTGTAAGGWDTAANRDAAIATINGLQAYAAEQKADFDAIVADVADIRSKYAAAVTLANEVKAQLNALLTELRLARVIAP